MAGGLHDDDRAASKVLFAFLKQVNRLFNVLSDIVPDVQGGQD